jgi:FlaA1/EpsC-like NDP-sugar epimerase
MGFISTDKATNPTNTMGATKLLAERLMAAADYNKGEKRTVFCSVRFGNVLGSSGSVIPVFRKMIRDSKAIKITEPSMTRFIMTIPEAAVLVLEAAAMARGGETFILKMKSLKLGDLADIMIDEVARKCGYSPDEIEKKIIGLRPGEKVHEDLITETEWARTLETASMYIILSPIDKSRKKTDYSAAGAEEPKTKNYNSKDSGLLSKEEIRGLLKREKLV